MLALVASSGCGASLSDVAPLIERCEVSRVEYLRSGVFVVRARGGSDRAGDGDRERDERRIEYGGDPEALHAALDAAQARCGEVPRLRE